MEFMKWSKYNIVYSLDNEKDIVYNYAWDSVIILLKELSSIVISRTNQIDDLQNIHPDL